jgi:hypothetical protein
MNHKINFFYQKMRVNYNKFLSSCHLYKTYEAICLIQQKYQINVFSRQYVKVNLYSLKISLV